MGAVWVDHPSWEIVQVASDLSGRDVAHLLLEADKDELRQTRNAQLVTFVSSLIALDALERVGLEPGGVAGHSLGEYTALVASGALALEDGINLVVERGEAMQAAAEESSGTMAAILGLGDDDAMAACMRAEADVWVANFNAPGQIVVAGTPQGIECVTRVAKEMGAKKVLSIPVGGAFHSPLMSSAKDRLRKALGTVQFEDPEIPVVANVDAKVHPLGGEWSSLLSAQLCSPVRWHQTLETFEALGARAYIEVGTGGVLVGLARRIVGDSKALVVAKPDDIEFLLGVLSDGKPLQAYVASHGGEHTHIAERVIVSPIAGIFDPSPSLGANSPSARHLPNQGAGKSIGDAKVREATVQSAPGVGFFPVHIGDSIGEVSEVPVLSQFQGNLMGFLVMPGERVAVGQPLAWLTVDED